MKQKTVHELRQSLEVSIPEALYDLDPEDTFAGVEDAVPLWNDGPESAGDVTLAQADEPAGETHEMALEETFEFGPEIDAELARAKLGGTESERIRQSVMVKGVDALAFYVTFHAKGPQWGIYIPVSSLVFLGERFASAGIAAWNACLKIAFRSLHQHELFHFGTDYLVAQLELLSETPCWKPARQLRDPKLGYIVLEEKLANAQMLFALARPPKSLRAPARMAVMRKFVGLQPEGYRDALQVKTRATFDELSSELVGNYIDGDPRIGAMNYMLLYPRWPTLDWRYCPVHLIHDEKRLDLPILDVIRFANIPEIYETDRFRRQLSELAAPLRRNWEKAQRQLVISTAYAGLDFKPWQRSEGIYSIRLSKGFRAHLRYVRTEQRWYADEVGNHKRMGHG